MTSHDPSTLRSEPICYSLPRDRYCVRSLSPLAKMFVVLTGVLMLVGCQGEPPQRRSTKADIKKPLPEFALTQQDGTSFGSQNLRGKVWVGNFVFTRCGSTCPRQTKDLVRLQKEIADHAQRDSIHFVSFSVDPEFDTPETLTAYAKTYKADVDHWSFLTGDRKAIWNLCKTGFLLPVTHGSDTDPGMLIIHSPRCVLVDRKNRIRGFYETSDASDWKKLKSKIDALVAEEK